MTSTEIKGCLSLMGLLWTSYKPPQSETDMAAAIAVWTEYFGNIPCDEVAATIKAMAAEGGEFAPQIGQIYARIKENHTPKLKGMDNPFVQLAFTAAKMEGLDPPEATDLTTVRNWWFKVYKLGGVKHGND